MADPSDLSLPLRLTADGELAATPQDSPDHVADCVTVLARTELGRRALRPDLGLPDPALHELDTAGLQALIAEHEPRAVVTFDDTGDTLTPGAVTDRVVVRIAAPALGA